MGGCTLPHAWQKWEARISPHDQQLAVVSPLPAAATVLEVSIVIKNRLCGADALARDCRMHQQGSQGFPITGSQSVSRSAEGHAARSRLLAGEGARSTPSHHHTSHTITPRMTCHSRTTWTRWD